VVVPGGHGSKDQWIVLAPVVEHFFGSGFSTVMYDRVASVPFPVSATTLWSRL
jgi:hypothetical protein